MAAEHGTVRVELLLLLSQDRGIPAKPCPKAGQDRDWFLLCAWAEAWPPLARQSLAKPRRQPLWLAHRGPGQCKEGRGWVMGAKQALIHLAPLDPAHAAHGMN